MNERFKIAEATFFLAKMEESAGDRDAFRYNLSAFLSAARSVLQYAWNESKKKNSLQWYENAVVGNDVLSFFKDKRDANIHREEPANPSRHITVVIADNIGIFSLASEVTFNDKAVEMNRPSEAAPASEPPARKQEMTIRHRFDDWPGPEDVIALSRRYVSELESFVQEGMGKAILSG